MPEWTSEQQAVITELEKVGKIINAPEFQQVSAAFVEAHKHVFEFTDENKFEYSALHERYIELMEKALEEQAKEVDMASLMTGLPAFVAATAAAKDMDSGTGATIDFLLTLTEFTTFKSMMLAANMAAVESAAPVVGGDVVSDAALSVFKSALIDPVVIERSKELLRLSSGESDVVWKPISEKAGVYTLEGTELGSSRFMRSIMQMGLSVEHTLNAHFNMCDPELSKWEDTWGKVEVVREKREGKLHDQLVKVHLKLPGVVKFIPGITKFIHLRMIVERDQPVPGSAIVVANTWDMDKNAPDLGRMGVVRCAIVEPTGPNNSRMCNLSKPPPIMPEWVMSLFMSNTILAGAIQTTEKYKRLKGLA